MESPLIILGEDAPTIFPNLNMHYSNNKKIILPGSFVLKYMEGDNIEDILTSLSSTDNETYLSMIKSDEFSQRLKSLDVKRELVHHIQENLTQLTDGLGDVKLKDYNFVNSISPDILNVTLRTENFKVSRIHKERSSLSSIIVDLLQSYLTNSANLTRKNKLAQFQIEVSQFENISKKVYLKKDANSILLASSLGYEQNSPVDFDTDQEVYTSIGEEYKFFSNNQSYLITKEHSKLVMKNISPKEKILSNEELTSIHENTRNINDALIELSITQKGNIFIDNLSYLENHIYEFSDSGYFIHKSSNNFNQISITTLRDDLTEEYANPNYLLIRNGEEVRELFNNIEKVSYIDGVIINTNIYHPLLDHIGNYYGIDVISYTGETLQKTLQANISPEPLTIENPEKKSSGDPFSSILEETKEEKQETSSTTEWLKTVEESLQDDSSSQQNTDTQEQQNQIENVAESIISSPNASMSANNNTQDSSLFSSSSLGGGRKTAIGMLAEAVEEKQSSESKGANEESEKSNQQIIDATKSNKDGQEPKKTEVFTNNEGPGNQWSGGTEEKEQTPQSSHLSVSESAVTESTMSHAKPDENTGEETISRYENVLATSIITSSSFDGDALFIESQEDVDEKKNQFQLITDPSERVNSNIEYVIPVSLKQEKDPFLPLINSPSEYFLLSSDTEKTPFVNISHIDETIRGSFLDEVVSKFGSVYLIMTRQDISLLEDKIDKIKGIYVKDLGTQENLETLKNELLSFEKKLLMKKL